MAAKKRPRAFDFGVEWSPEGLAVGWAFDVSTACRDNLDIKLLEYVDAEHKKRTGQTRYVKRWSRGVPPCRTFERGHVFYDPPGVRALQWGQAVQMMRRSITVLEGDSDVVGGLEGNVAIRLDTYEGGRIVTSVELRGTQAELEAFLRSGDPGNMTATPSAARR